jgi:hypothetical protein
LFSYLEGGLDTVVTEGKEEICDCYEVSDKTKTERLVCGRELTCE